MGYNIAKLSDINPTLVTDLKNHCYTIIGLCQQVHREMGPFLNEYMYQEALDILFEENNIERVKEYYFSVTFLITDNAPEQTFRVTKKLLIRVSENTGYS